MKQFASVFVFAAALYLPGEFVVLEFDSRADLQRYANEELSPSERRTASIASAADDPNRMFRRSYYDNGHTWWYLSFTVDE